MSDGETRSEGGIRAGINSRAEKAQKSISGLADVSGTLQGIWGTIIGTSDRLQTQVGRVNDSVSQVAGSLAETMVPAFRTAADIAVRAADAFTALPGPMRAFIAMALGIATALAVVVPAAAAVTSALASISLPVLALIALGAALYAAWQANLFGIRDVAEQALGQLRRGFVRVVEFVRPYWEQFVAGLRELWAIHGSAITEQATENISRLIAGFKRFVEITEPLWKAYFRVLVAQVKAAFAIVKTVVLTAIDALLTAFRVFSAVTDGNFGEAWEIIKGFAGRTFERLKTLVDQLTGIFEPFVEDALAWAKDLMENFLNGLKEKREKLLAKVAEIEQKIVDTLSALPDQAIEWGEDLIDNLVQGIQNKLGALESTVSDVESSIQDAMSFDLVANDRMARRWGSDLVEEFSRGVGGNIGAIQRAGPAGEPGAFGIPQPPSGGGTGTAIDVTVEAGAVQLNGRGTGRLNADQTAEGIGREMADRFGRR